MKRAAIVIAMLGISAWGMAQSNDKPGAQSPPTGPGITRVVRLSRPTLRPEGELAFSPAPAGTEDLAGTPRVVWTLSGDVAIGIDTALEQLILQRLKKCM